MHELAQGRHYDHRAAPGPTGLPLPRPPRPQIATSHPNGYLWKRDHVDPWIGRAPAVWIDDDFTTLDHTWAAERTVRGCRTRLIQPDPYVGLQTEHLLGATTWVSEGGWRRTTVHDASLQYGVELGR